MTGAGQVVVVGLGASGWSGATLAQRDLLQRAVVLVGPDDLLDGVPPSWPQARVPWPTTRDGMTALLSRYAGWPLVAVVAGDPLGSPLVRELVALLGPGVTTEPGVPLAVLAAARLGWGGADVAHPLDVVDLRGRDPHVLLRELADGRRLLVLPDPDGPAEGPAQALALLTAHGYGATRVTALARLGGPDEASAETLAAAWPAGVGLVDVLALELVGPLVSPWAPGLPDASYEPVGGVLPRDHRAVALARLAPQPGQLLWDLGSGGGSVAVEWLRTHPACRALAVEADPARVATTRGNARRLGVPALQVLTGTLPGVLVGLEVPDAVLVAGEQLLPSVLEAVRAALRPDGRLVAQATSAGSAALLEQAHAAHGGELTRLAVEVAARTAGGPRWTPRAPVVQWAWQRA